MKRLYMRKVFETSEPDFFADLPEKLAHEFMKYIALDNFEQEGRACIKGTKVTVKSIVAQLRDGTTTSEILSSNPDLTADMVQACHDYSDIGNYYNPCMANKYPISMCIKFLDIDAAAVAIIHANEKVKPRPWKIIGMFNTRNQAAGFCELMFPRNKYSWGRYVNTPYLLHWCKSSHLIAENPYSIDGYTMNNGHTGMNMWGIRTEAIKQGHDSLIIKNAEWSDNVKGGAVKSANTVFGVFNLHQIIEAQDGWQMDDPNNPHKNGAGLYLFSDSPLGNLLH